LRRSLIFALTVLFVFASYAFGQGKQSAPPPLPPAAQAEPESIALTAEELKQRGVLGEEEQKAGRKLQAAYEAVRSAATDAEIIAAVNAFQAGLYLRAEFERKFKEWQDAAKAAHACAECQFDAQFTKLVKPQPKKEEKKN
jgi:hypothetical protein